MGARRQAATATATAAATSENADVDTDGARRARKRITDRKSQRHHRERQRAYVRELEETVKSLRQSCADVGGGDAAALLAENERLRQRCQKLEAAMAKIKSLSANVYSPDGPTEVKVSGSETSQMEEIMDNSGLQQNLSSPSTTGSEPIALQPMHLPNLPDQTGGVDSMPLGGIFADPGQNLPVLEIDDALHTMTAMPDYAPHTTTSIPMADFARAGRTDQGAQNDTEQDQSAEADQEYDQAYSEELDRCLTGILDGTAMTLDLVPTSLTTKDPLLWRLAGSRTSSDSNFSPQLMYPTAVAPLYYWDKFILRVIEEAKTQHSMGLYPTEPASLRSVLSDKSSDVLAARLFHWLTAHGGAPLQVLLAIFWVQYLFLRWHVLGTYSAYMQMPKFMRPTELELRIPHPICIGMLVWPDIRRTMIRDAGVLDPEHVGQELLTHLSKTWAPRDGIGGQLIGSTDVLAIVEKQSMQLDTWKLSPDFRDKHPEFGSCQLVYA